MSKMFAFIVVGLAVNAVMFHFGCDGAPNNKDDSIHIAIVSSETGDLAEIGKDMTRGAILAIDEANAQGGVRGHQIQYHTFDDQGDKNSATNVANLVCQDKRLIGVIGHLTSGCMLAAAPIYARAEMPVLMPVPTNPEITKKNERNLFRIPPSDEKQAPFLARYLLSHNPKAPVAIVHDLTDYGLGFATAFRTTFEAGGQKVVAFEGEHKESGDFRTLVTKLRELKPKYVVLGATYDMGAPFVRRMRELGLDATALAGDGCFGSEFLKQTGKAGEGTIMSFIAPDRTVSTAAGRFFSNFETKYGKVVSFAPLGYDAASVLIEALRKSTNVSRNDIISTIHGSGFELEGITGKIRFAENGDNANTNLSLYVVRDGRYVLLQP